MKYTAKQKWVTFFKSLWTPTIYFVLQVGIGFFMFFPLLIVTVAKMLADPDGIKTGKMREIVQAIEPDPAIILGLLGYSKKAIDNFRTRG